MNQGLLDHDEGWLPTEVLCSSVVSHNALGSNGPWFKSQNSYKYFLQGYMNPLLHVNVITIYLSWFTGQSKHIVQAGSWKQKVEGSELLQHHVCLYIHSLSTGGSAQEFQRCLCRDLNVLDSVICFIQWKPDITGMVGPEQKSCYSRSLLHPKSRETRTD